jgi:hypothetical protein
MLSKNACRSWRRHRGRMLGLLPAGRRRQDLRQKRKLLRVSKKQIAPPSDEWVCPSWSPTGDDPLLTRNTTETTKLTWQALSGSLQMKWPLGTLLLALLTSTAMAYPQPVQWQTYSIAETGTSVDLPTSIFTEKAERPAGYGIRLKTADGRAELTVHSRAE